MQLTESVAVRLRNGDRFPEITVARTGGGWIALPGDLAGSFGVVIMYRGAWCPYCNAQLSARQCRLQLWRLRLPEGTTEFVAPVPEGCGASFSLSRDGRRAVCDYNTRQSDLVVATGFDPELK
jgi:hypothetical protein